MNHRQKDVFEWLLPCAEEEERIGARTLITFLRLLRDDVRGAGAETVGLNLRGAHRELERGGKNRVLSNLADLLRFHLQGEIQRDAFTHFGEPRNSHQESWSELERLRGQVSGLPSIPEPGESTSGVTLRLLASAERLGAGERWLSIWRARRARALRGAAEAHSLWEEILRRHQAPEDIWLRVAACAGLVEGHLDRGDVSLARAFLERDVNTVRLTRVAGELAWLKTWTALLEGDIEGAARLVNARPARVERLPLVLVELRERVPQWARFLPGLAPRLGREPSSQAEGERALFGADALAVFRPRSDGSFAGEHTDLAPELVQRLPAHLSLRRDAWRRPGEPEHRAYAQGQVLLQQRTGSHALPAAVGAARAAALALVPIVDGGGAVLGWLHLECAHHLLPSRARLRALAAAWGEKLSAAGSNTQASVAERRQQHVPAAAAHSVFAAGPADPRTLFAQALLERLPMKMGRRRALFIETGEDGPRLLACSGTAFALQEPRLSSLRTPESSLSTPRLFARPNTIAFHRSGASGVHVPLVHRGRVIALLVVESERACDFSPADLQRLDTCARKESPLWRWAQFSAWHRVAFGQRVHLEPGTTTWREWTSAALLATACQAPVVLSGPAGSGKRVLARWLHFEGRETRGVPRSLLPAEVESFLDTSDRGGANEGLLVLEKWEAADEAARRSVRVCWERSRSSSSPLRLVFLTRENARASFPGALELCVHGLADRRDEIVGLVGDLLLSISESESLQVPGLDDDALALLWRQPWEGNIAELRSFLTRLSAQHAGEEVGAEELSLLAARIGRPLLGRLPSRSPRRQDLLAAMASTTHANGSWNKSRAAHFLGWDRDTLTVRLEGIVSERSRPLK